MIIVFSYNEPQTQDVSEVNSPVLSPLSFSIWASGEPERSVSFSAIPSRMVMRPS